MLKSLQKSGLLLIFIAAFFFGIMVLLVKMAAKTIPSHEILLFRSICGIVVIYSLVFSKAVRLKFVNRPLLLFRGVVGGAAVMCFYYAISKINLGIATFLNATYPIFATIFAVTFIKEKVSWDGILALIFSVFGMYLILNPGNVALEAGHIFGLVSGILAGAVILSVRKLRQTDSSWAIFYSFSVACMIYSLPLTITNYKIPNLPEFIILFLMAAVSTIAQIIMSYAYKYAKASEGSVVILATPIFAAIFGYMFFAEIFTPIEIIGAALVLSGGAYLVIKERMVRTSM